MLVTATITRADFVDALAQLTPLKIRLASGEEGDKKYARVDPPTLVELVPGVGLRVHASGEILWPLLGLDTAVTLRGFTLLLSPEVVMEGALATIAFHLRVEEADAVAVPAFVEKPLVARVNEALEATRLVWKAQQGLDFRFGLGSAMPDTRAEIAATGVSLAIDANALTLSAPFRFTAVHEEPTHG